MGSSLGSSLSFTPSPPLFHRLPSFILGSSISSIPSSSVGCGMGGCGQCITAPFCTKWDFPCVAHEEAAVFQWLVLNRMSLPSQTQLLGPQTQDFMGDMEFLVLDHQRCLNQSSWLSWPFSLYIKQEVEGTGGRDCISAGKGNPLLCGAHGHTRGAGESPRAMTCACPRDEGHTSTDRHTCARARLHGAMPKSVRSHKARKTSAAVASAEEMLGSLLAGHDSSTPGKDRAPDMLTVLPEDLQSLHREGMRPRSPANAS